MAQEMTKEAALKAVRENGFNLRDLPDDLRNDKDVVLTALMNDDRVLKFASRELLSDKEFMLAEVKNSGLSLELASPILRNNRQIVLAAVNENAHAILYASPTFDDDEEVNSAALACVKRVLFPDGKSRSVEIWEWEYDNRIAGYVEERRGYSGAKKRERLALWQRDVKQWQQYELEKHYSIYTKWRVAFERMPKYETWRQHVFEKYGKRCERGGEVDNLEIHHKKSLYSMYKDGGFDKVMATEGIEKALDKTIGSTQLWDIDNGSVLCHECHERMESSLAHKDLSSS